MTTRMFCKAMPCALAIAETSASTTIASIILPASRLLAGRNPCMIPAMAVRY
jgi:hypothetical protein